MTRGRMIGLNGRALRNALGFAFLSTGMLLSFPGASQAIQLRWSTGAMDLSFSSATRCTLVVEADSSEGRLPPEWRLLWAADSSCSIVPLALDQQAACVEDIAQISEVDPPASAADSAANQTTAHFCSAGSEAASAAYFMLDLPAGSSGKLKVVALDPADLDSSRVLESPEVTFNGGSNDPYPAIILHASHWHASALLRVTAVGSGLTTASAIVLSTSGVSSVMPLSIVAQSDASLTAEASLPSALPASELRLTAFGGAATSTAVAGDVVLGPSVSGISSAYFVDPDPSVYPKDFAFIHNTVPTGTPNVWRGLFHLFYTRTSKTLPEVQNERTLGHAWASDPSDSSWHWDLDAFPVQAIWDSRHVWAPSIIQYNGAYHMFYTGVDQAKHQRIGFATTTFIDTTNTEWFRDSTWIFSVADADWAVKSGEQQCRDPFVIADPDSADRFLMFYVAANQNDGGRNSVGVARSDSASLRTWDDHGYFRSTDSAHGVDIRNDESPHVFPDADHAARGQSSQARWRLMFTDGPQNNPDSTIRFNVKAIGASLGDTALANWTNPAGNLWSYLHSDQTVFGWEATEYLRVGNADYMAAYDGDGIAITRIYWSGFDFILGFPSVAGVRGQGRAAGDGVRLTLTELVPGTPRAGFRIQVPGAMRVQLAVYDVLGRRVRALLDRELPVGGTPVVWDGRDASGSTVWSGMYFVRLSGGGVNRVVRVPLVR